MVKELEDQDKKMTRRKIKRRRTKRTNTKIKKKQDEQRGE